MIYPNFILDLSYIPCLNERLKCIEFKYEHKKIIEDLKIKLKNNI